MNALIFLPEAGIYPFLRTLAICGDALKFKKYSVFIFQCSGMLPRCPMMPCFGMPFNMTDDQKKEKCKACFDIVKKVSEVFGFIIVDAKNYIEKKYFNEIDVQIQKLDIKQLVNLERNNVLFGKVAWIDFCLEAKTLSSDALNDEQMSLYKNYLLSSVRVYYILKNIISDYKLDIVLGYNPYSQNIAASKACNDMGVLYRALTNTFIMGANPRFIQVDDAHMLDTCLRHKLRFQNAASITVSKEAVRACFDDILFKMFSHEPHVFSSLKSDRYAFHNIRKRLGIKDICNTVIGVFTSSLDEKISMMNMAESCNYEIPINEAFPDQVEWLLALRDYFKSRDDVCVIVKVHPREFRAPLSEHARLLMDNFRGTDTDNFKFIWPENDVSTYDLMEIIDYCLISHTTVGFECACLGIPVLSFVQNFNYPTRGVIETASTKEDYFVKLDAMTKKEASLLDIVHACRYFNWITFMCSIDLGEGISGDFYDSRIGVRVDDVKKTFISKALENKIDYIKHNVELLRKTNNSMDDEKEAVKRQIRRVINSLYFYESNTKTTIQSIIKRILRIQPEQLSDDYVLKYSENIALEKLYQRESSKNKKIRYVIKDGVYSVLICGGKSYRRCSKLINNLARIHELD